MALAFECNALASAGMPKTSLCAAEEPVRPLAKSTWLQNAANKFSLGR